MSKDTYVCPLCKKRKRGEMFHCRDHCMDMCRDHVRESGPGQFVCPTCEKIVHRFLHDGYEWVEA